jgi:hypothetical protein
MSENNTKYVPINTRVGREFFISIWSMEDVVSPKGCHRRLDKNVLGVEYDIRPDQAERCIAIAVWIAARARL